MLRMFTLPRFVTLIVLISLAGVPAAAAAPRATSPPLGAADSFVVLAATAITNVPASAISGDVGLSPASGSNYTGLGLTDMLTGTIYAVDAGGPAGSVIDPALLTMATTDLVAAYNGLASQACDITYPGTQDLAGLSLVPGVYCADDFALTGVLTLNGIATDVWVFKSASTLITTGAADVILPAGGVPCAVWWQVGSSATLGTNTSLAGNILAMTSISLATGANLDGRALARTGAVTLAQNPITRPVCVLAVPTITTQIHDVNHVEVTSASVGTVIHDMALVTGTLGIIPTGVVSFTVYTNQTCTGGGTFAGAVTLDGAGVADPSNTTTLTSAGLSYLAHYNGDVNYEAADGPCEVLRALAVPSISTEIHDAGHVEVTTAPTGTVVHDMALVTGTLGIPSGVVDFTVYANQTCTGAGTFAGAVTLDALGVADPSDTATLTGAGLSYLAHYNGDANYEAADGPCEVLVPTPTAVELLSFQAERLGGLRVSVNWATALEVDNFGFNLYRASLADLKQASLVHFEPAVAQGSGSGAYAYVDTLPYAGTWWYWLADVDTQGSEMFHASPVYVIVQLSSGAPYQVYLPLIGKGGN